MRLLALTFVGCLLLAGCASQTAEPSPAPTSGKTSASAAPSSSDPADPSPSTPPASAAPESPPCEVQQGSYIVKTDVNEYYVYLVGEQPALVYTESNGVGGFQSADSCPSNPDTRVLPA